MILFLTALAGGAGGAARVTVDNWVSRRSRLSMPLGTFVVNVSACFLLGLVTGLVTGLVASQASWQPLRQVLGVGFLGGYSTFSTASVEAARLLGQRRYLVAAGHAGGMLLASGVAIVLGLAAAFAINVL